MANMSGTFGKGFGKSNRNRGGNNDSFEVDSRGSDLDQTNNADLAYMLNHPAPKGKNSSPKGKL